MDLATEAYRLEARVGQDAPEALISDLKTQAATALQGANVQFDIVRLSESQSGGAPLTLALVSAEGATLSPIDLQSATGPGTDLKATFEAVVMSPTRSALLEVVSRAFGGILLIDGTDTAANARARAAIQEAIDQIRGHMRTLPKAIAQPPELVALGVETLQRERVLLWSLSLDTQPAPQPRALILYGRLRWIGPVMKGEEISPRNIVGLFSMVGADCECGLDLQWTLGTRVPVRWEERIHAMAAKSLGFDPENPIVKTEILSILERRRSELGPRSRDTESRPLASDPKPSHLAETLDQAKATMEARPAKMPAEPPPGEVEAATPMAWWILGGLAAFIAGASVILLLRARRQARVD